MSKTMKHGLLLALVLWSAAACTRRVRVESEPNRAEAAPASSEIAPRQ